MRAVIMMVASVLESLGPADTPEDPEYSLGREIPLRLRGSGMTAKVGCQGAIVTGVPAFTDLKKFSAMNSGMRMQPCDAG